MRDGCTDGRMVASRLGRDGDEFPFGRAMLRGDVRVGPLSGGVWKAVGPVAIELRSEQAQLRDGQQALGQ